MGKIKVIHKKLHIAGLKERYTFLHVTDTHALSFQETADAALAEYAEKRRALFTRDGITPDVWLRRYMDYANEAEVSGVLLTGDIIDYTSPENLNILKECLSSLKVPYLYVPGNHDWSYFDGYQTQEAIDRVRPMFREFCGGDENFHTLTVGELTFAALDNSMDVYWPGTAKRLKRVIETSEYVLVLQHVPLYCDTLHEDTVKVWQRDITLGGRGIVLDESADEAAALLTASGAVKAVFCGHLHFSHEDLVGGMRKQYVTAQSSFGEVTLFEISG